MNYSIITEPIRQSREYRDLVKSLRKSPDASGYKTFVVRGLSEGGETAMLTALLSDYQKDLSSSVLILYPDERDAAKAADCFREVGLEADYLPARDYNFNNVKASRDFEHERLGVLYKLVYGIPTVITSSVEAVLQITDPFAGFSEKCIKISETDTVDIRELSLKLSEAGYFRTDTVEGVGQFASRGGIIDIYPPIGDPVRIELFGDEIDRMGYFDVMTQRFTGGIDEVIISPVREMLASDEKRDELSKYLKTLLKNAGRNGGNENILSSVAGEIAMLDGGLQLDSYDKYIPLILPEGECLLDYFSGLIVALDTAKLEERANAAYALTDNIIAELVTSGELEPIKSQYGYMRQWCDIELSMKKFPSVTVDSFLRAGESARIGGSFSFQCRHIPSYSGNMSLLREDIAGFIATGAKTVILCSNEAEERSIISELAADGITAVSAERMDGREFLDSDVNIALLHGSFHSGFELINPHFALLDFTVGVQGKRAASKRHISKAKKQNNSEAIMSYADLNVGDIIVHSVYGIGQFMGIETMTVAGVTRDYVNLKYAGSDKLFLPTDQLDLVSKYIGAGADDGSVKLSKMGGSDWIKAKTKARASARDMARELIDLYAKRKRTPGIAFDRDDALYREFSDSFEYEETDGQLTAIGDIRRDMEAGCPMDRLLCGDVGYGKTEVALRAAFKAVNSGYQVAILVPTTILAYQHYQTAVSRFRGFPANIDMLSRFRTSAQQAVTLRRLKRGDIDVIIGTHRLLSKDIEFNKLGLIIIDEEQRFGVAQKEKLKQMSQNCDVLTLTATPIPRTLNMAMSGILDMSILEEAPGSRFPVQTYVMEYDQSMINEAIRRELRRGGQVFYLNNNIEAVYSIAARLSAVFPDAHIASAHGRMSREELEEIWGALVRGEVDILVSTTIIETGIDVPNANTLIIERADRYGLSQLHQIRGRVGRSSRRAYAYFTYPPMRALSEIATKRLEAIREYAEFGAGFKIALRDLEIRGAGNLLGAEQHGHLDAVGYDMYIRLLNEAVLEEKGIERKSPVECTVTVACDAYLSEKYIHLASHRMEMYKKIAHIAEREDYIDMIDELCDRFSSPPQAAVNLCKISYIRALGIRSGLTKIEYSDGQLKLTPDGTDYSVFSQLASVMPQLALRMALGNAPHAVCRLKKTDRLLDAITDILLKYLSFIPTQK